MNGASLASNLDGKIIDKWKVIEKREKTKEDASGAFSSCYKVENIETGQIGFLKAFNYQYAFNQIGAGKQSADFMRDLTSNYIYERDLLTLCKEHNMKKIVTAMDHGEYSESGKLLPVPYLVFEIADGSLKNIKSLKDPDLAWKLSAFHGCLVGLSQLHSKRIAHQDLKPSNILIFGENISKLSDLGNATQDGNASPLWNNLEHCGDLNFAPIELLYGYFSPNWNTRRFGADLFMVSGIITYLLTGVNFLHLIISNLPDDYSPSKFGGTFAQVKPHIMDAYYKSLHTIEKGLPDSIKKGLMEIILQLSHPIPEERGNPRNLYTNISQYSLRRYISITDRLAKQIEIEKIISNE